METIYSDHINDLRVGDIVRPQSSTNLYKVTRFFIASLGWSSTKRTPAIVRATPDDLHVQLEHERTGHKLDRTLDAMRKNWRLVTGVDSSPLS